MSDPQHHSNSFIDTSVECAICLEALDENENDQKLITLGCGHRWHLNCLRRQLESAKPSSTKRLLFSGCQCAKCGIICEHKDLEDLTRTTDALREKVNALLKEQLKQSNDGADGEETSLQTAWKEANRGHTKESILKQARRKYAFYLCSHCDEPYFGGTVTCADFGEETEDEVRLCVGCTPHTQLICRNPLGHGGSLIWKCRYCCQPATHVCYGNVHFCDSCHNRNSQRVQELSNIRGGSGAAKPPPLSAIPCPGNKCPFPKGTSENFHYNGPSLNCEKVYGCARCQSVESSAQRQEPGSHNLLQNPSGQEELRGWQQLNRSMTWRVEESEIAVNASTTKNFVSSYRPCVMSQTLDLTRICGDRLANERNFNPNSFRIQASARYMGRTDCPSVFRLNVMLHKNLQDRHSVRELATQTLEAPPDYWETASLCFENVSLEDFGYLTFVVLGQDRRFWQGNFGSKVADCTVRVLWVGEPNAADRMPPIR